MLQWFAKICLDLDTGNLVSRTPNSDPDERKVPCSLILIIHSVAFFSKIFQTILSLLVNMLQVQANSAMSRLCGFEDFGKWNKHCQAMPRVGWVHTWGHEVSVLG